ncbi:MAG: STAS domain-containing protein [Thermodesulfobacteriota bacterium]|nr:STAS domain-containing protein [Thermodesulfobacteriota bacterium]
MDFKTKKDGDSLSIKISGAVGTEEAEILRAELRKTIDDPPKKVRMDLSLVPSMGSSGIGKILLFYKELDKKGAGFEIKGIHENLFNIFKSIKLDKIFPISMG